ncbi:hypothetical protein CLV78_11925 [Aliiruegeria haliotis]|uniref:Uncharacterized protein n=1 Tax=Aliiruegeria haliotis TaxID=1280846 RepID=A0A2T0REV3_9RHOB|nr:hypothetical protein [Aliiruegeria haliotis]PRY19693.1 hypothetical protein CLV78_11925 [Aliiruegeria haliotis]
MTDTSTGQSIDTDSILKELDSGLDDRGAEGPDDGKVDLEADPEKTSESALPVAEATAPPERPAPQQEDPAGTPEQAVPATESTTSDVIDPSTGEPQIAPETAEQTFPSKVPTDQADSPTSPSDSTQSPSEEPADAVRPQANDGHTDATGALASEPESSRSDPAASPQPEATQAQAAEEISGAAVPVDATPHTSEAEGAATADTAGIIEKTSDGEGDTPASEQDSAPSQASEPSGDAPAPASAAASEATGEVPAQATTAAPEASGAEHGAGDAAAEAAAAGGQFDLHDVHLPYYMTPFGESDILFTIIVVFILLAVFLLGLFYFKLHSLPEKMAHDTAQFQLVAILALLALFTHNNLFWIFAILLAAIKLPDFITPVLTMAKSQERVAILLSEIHAAQTLAAAAPEVGAVTQEIDARTDTPSDHTGPRAEGG